MDYLETFMRAQQYPEKAIIDLGIAKKSLFAHVAAQRTFEMQLDAYRNKAINYAQANEAIRAVSCDYGINPCIGFLLFYLLLTDELAKRYTQAHIPHEIFEDTVRDLLYKAQECYQSDDCFGLCRPAWFAGFFEMTRFALGRLQFETSSLPCDCIVKGRRYPIQTPVINIHIPAAGALRQEACCDAFAKARNFYSKQYPLFMCKSWLLFPGNREMLKPDSNIVRFMDRFQLIETIDALPSEDMWHIFGTNPLPPLTDLPRDTTLRRAYADWLSSGKKVGKGLGVFLR